MKSALALEVWVEALFLVKEPLRSSTIQKGFCTKCGNYIRNNALDGIKY